MSSQRLLWFTAAMQLVPAPSVCRLAPYQSLHHCPEPSCSQYVLLEAENFTVDSSTKLGGWVPQAWAHDPNLFSSDVSNVFMNRRAYLHSDANGTVGAQAFATIKIPTPGTYTILARFEAGYRFSSPFNVSINQDGVKVYQQEYGLRKSPKVWGFAGCTNRYGGLEMLSTECRWNYGSTENMVWEGPSISDNYTARLAKGEATVVLTVADAAGDITERNIDTLLLTQNKSDIIMRLQSKSRPLQLDGLIGTQEGEVFAKVESHEDLQMNLTLPLTSSRSPLWEGKLIFPVVAWKRERDPANKSQYNYTKTIISGCGDKGRVSVLPAQPDPTICVHCVLNISNCSAEQRTGICHPDTPLPPSTGDCNIKKLLERCRQKVPRPPAPLSASQSQCVTFVLVPREKTEWTDVGKLIDTMNHASWNLPAGNYTLTLGLKDSKTSKIHELGVFPSGGRPLQILTDASIRASRRVRARASDFYELYNNLAKLEKQLVGKPPTHVPIFARTYQRDMPQGGLGPVNGTGLPDPKYKAAQAHWERMFGISPVDQNQGTVGPPSADAWRTEWGYLDLRGYVPKTMPNAAEIHESIDKSDLRSPPKISLAQKLQTYIDAGLQNKIRAIKLGDEIHLPKPSGNNTDNDFFAWAQNQGLDPKDIGCSAFDSSCSFNDSFALASSNPALYYYSHKYSNDYGIESGYKNATKTISSMLPKALAGANYAPTECGAGVSMSCMSYLPTAFKWIRAFRAGTFTLPFTEDYIFQQPPGSQQMFTLVIDVERAAVRPQGLDSSETRNTSILIQRNAPLKTLPSSATTPGRPIMQYVMTHWPGNTAKSWRRQLYGDLAHGVKWIHLYVLAPSFSSPAGDYSDGDNGYSSGGHYGGMYQEILTATHELGQWDDILSASVPHAAGVKVALLFSETGDIYLDNYGTAGAAKRSLYIALVHSQIAIDVVTEEDLMDDSTLNSYSVLYVCHSHIHDDAASAIQKWVSSGGTVISSVSGGLLNQKNKTSVPFSTMLGFAHPSSVYTGTGQDVEARGRIDFIKQDLAFAEILDTAVTIPDDKGTNETAIKNQLVVVGEKARFESPPDAVVIAHFSSDGSPAAFRRKVGSGHIYFFALHLGLAYFHPAIPKRPVARGSRDECFNHWVPTDFNAAARGLLAAPALAVPGAAPVLSSEPRVDIGVLAAAGKGTVLPVVNWAGKPVKALQLTLQFNCRFTKASLASGDSVTVSQSVDGGWTVLIFDLDVADAIILR